MAVAKTQQNRAARRAASSKKPADKTVGDHENVEDDASDDAGENGYTGLTAADIAKLFSGSANQNDNDDDDEDDSDDDDDGDEDDDNEDGVVTLEAIGNLVTKAVSGLDVDKKIEAGLDRRINVVLKEIRKGGTAARPKGKVEEDEDDDDSGSQPKAGSASYARLAFKGSLADQEFSSKEEREFARGIGQRIMTSAAATGFDGKDPDTYADEVASELATEIAALNKHYQTKVTAALKSRGLLKVDTKGQGTDAKNKRSVGDQSSFKAGQARAQKRHGTATE